MKKFFTDIFKKKNGSIGDRNIMHPEREWFFGIFGGLVFLVIGLFWSFSIYTQFSNVSIATTSAVDEASVYRGGLVESALSDLLERKRSYDAVRAELMKNHNAPTIEVVESETIVNEAELETETEADLVIESEEDPDPLDESTFQLSD